MLFCEVCRLHQHKTAHTSRLTSETICSTRASFARSVCMFAVPLGLALLMTVAQVIRKYSNNDVNFFRWSVLMVIAAMVVALYSIIFPRCAYCQWQKHHACSNREVRSCCILVFCAICFHYCTALTTAHIDLCCTEICSMIQAHHKACNSQSIAAAAPCVPSFDLEADDAPLHTYSQAHR